MSDEPAGGAEPTREVRSPVGRPPSVAAAGHEAGQARAEFGWAVRLLAGTRYIVVIAVLGLSLAATMLLVYAALAVAETVWDTVTRGDLSPSVAKGLTVTFVELTDAFLLGAVLLIVALGLYELFVEPELPVPAWLRVTNLDQLKEKLIGVIVVLLGVSFLGYVVNWNGDADILALGAAVAAVVAALAFQGFASKRVGGKNGDAPDAG